MSTNAKLPTCDIKIDHVIPNEAADASSKVEISSDMPVNNNVVKRKHDKPDKGLESNSESFLDQLDAKGNMIHCSEKATVSHNFLRLKEGGIYSVKSFAIKPNKDEYQILKNDAYPFQLQDFDGIESSDSKYLIDVSRYVTNVRRTNHLKSGSRNPDFHLTNHRGQSIKVTLWVSLGDVLIEKKPNRLLSLSTVRSPLMESGQGRDETSLYVGATRVRRIGPVRTANSFANRETKQSITRYRLEVDVSDNTAQVVVVMFNETATALVNCFADSLMDTVDESLEYHLNLPPALSNLIGAAHVMEINSHTYYEYGTFESFTCWQILPSKGIDDSVGSSNLDDYPDNQPKKIKRIVQDPSIVTPSKPVEERKKSRLETTQLLTLTHFKDFNQSPTK
nr:hypothetical protein [Tanacetum cinerariifolium]